MTPTQPQASDSQVRQQLQDLIDNTSDLIQIVTLDGRFLFVNRAWREAMGYAIEELPGLRLSHVLWPEVTATTLSALQRISNGEKIPDFETIFKNKAGKKIYLTGSVTCRYDNDRPVSFRCILHDSSSRVRAERAQNLYYSIANWTNNTQNLDDLYHRIHDELGKVIDASNFFIGLFDPTKNYMNFPYYVDEYFNTNIRFTKRKLGNGLTEYAIAANKPLFLYEKDIEELSQKNGIYIYGKIPKVMLSVPLRIGDRVTGIIGVKSYSNADQYRPRNLEMLEFISGQVALAIERKQNEVELARQTARLNAIFDGSSYLIWSVNKAFQLTAFNQNYTDFIKTQLHTVPSLNVSTERLGWQLLNIESRKKIEERYRMVFRGEAQVFELKLELRYGNDRWYEFSLSPIRLENDSIEEVSGLARDITARKVAEIALIESEEKFRGIFDNLQDIYCRTNREGIVTMISPSVVKRTGYTVEEVMNSDISTYFEDKSQINRALVVLLRDKSLRNFEATLRTKDGHLRQFMFNMLLFDDNAGQPIIAALARDITELKRNERELLKSKEEAEKLLKVKERFLANMSHEIRTPMNGVIGMIDLLGDTVLNDEQKDYVQTIRRSSETLLNILNDILDLSKIEAGKMVLHDAPFEFKEMFDKLVALFGQTAKNKYNELSYEIADNLPQYIISDQTRLLQILSNLTSNALKFTENGKVNIKVSSVWTKGKFYKIKIEVTDTGIGISEDNLKILFSAFSQVDNSSRKNFGGTGLGLAISKEICRLMKGDIGVQSAEGEGSTFWFSFETKETLIAPQQTQKNKDQVEIDDFFKNNRPKILIVDDNFVNRKVASEILKKAGCEVEMAESGQQAIALVRQSFEANNRRFEAIFMDIQMPDMDGIETTQNLREEYPTQLPTIVAMTAYSMKEDRERFLSQGMDDYLPKPIRAHLLVQKTKEVVEAGNHRHKSSEKKIQPPTIVEEINLPIIDLLIVKQLADLGGMELVSSIFEDFVIETQQLVAEANEAFSKADIAVVKSNLHTLKGSAGTIGVIRMAEVARIGEAKLKTNDTTTLEFDLQQLTSEFRLFMSSYQEILAKFSQQ